jgi:signal peptidase II
MTIDSSSVAPTPSAGATRSPFIIRLWPFVISLLCVALDQFSKEWVRRNLGIYEVWVPIPFLANYFDFLHTENTGAAFGMFQNRAWVFGAIAIVVSIAITYYTWFLPIGQKLVRLALGLQLGGALGNLLDRLLHPQSAVTDFLHFHYQNFSFPIFNLADAFISVGVAVLLLSMLFEEKENQGGKPAAVLANQYNSAAESSFYGELYHPPVVVSELQMPPPAQTSILPSAELAETKAQPTDLADLAQPQVANAPTEG